jgi:hypothetical protein
MEFLPSVRVGRVSLVETISGALLSIKSFFSCGVDALAFRVFQQNGPKANSGAMFLA